MINTTTFTPTTEFPISEAIDRFYPNGAPLGIQPFLPEVLYGLTYLKADNSSWSWEQRNEYNCYLWELQQSLWAEYLDEDLRLMRKLLS